MPNIINYREGDTAFDLHIPEVPPEYYSDGLGQVLIGPLNSKIAFYISNGNDASNIEQRHVTFRVTLPTVAALDLARTIITNAVQAKSDLSAHGEISLERLKQALADFEVEEGHRNTAT